MKLTRKGFEAWLNERLKSEDIYDGVVGYRGISCECPIATFLLEKSGADELYVRTYGITWFRGKHDYTMPMPKWATRFVEIIDSEEADERELVSIEEAMQAMERVKYEQG